MNLGRRRVTNEELCECFAAMKLSGAWAFLASGNVVFSSPKPRAEVTPFIEAGLKRWFDYEVRTFVRRAEDVAAIGECQPFTAAQLQGTTSNVQVALLENSPRAAQRKTALALATPQDRLVIVSSELYWLPQGNMSDSELDLNALSRALGAMTIRAQRTVTRLAAKLEA